MFKSFVKLSYIYEEFVEKSIQKHATIASDTAIRIMHSLIPKAVGNQLEAQLIQTHLAQKHLLGVAERYMERAAEIIVDELYHSEGSRVKFYSKAKNNLAKGNYLEVAKIASEDFAEEDNWEPYYGGEKWLKFSNQVINLGLSIEQMREAIASKDEDAINEAAGMLTVHMNVLDGLTHNTGSFIEKMFLKEFQEISKNYNIWEFDEGQKKLFELMDAKQLKNYENVLPYIKKHIQGNPSAYLYREHLSKLLSNYSPNLEESQDEILQIRARKEMQEFIHDKLDSIIKSIHKHLKSDIKIDNNIYDSELNAFYEDLETFSHKIFQLSQAIDLENIALKTLFKCNLREKIDNFDISGSNDIDQYRKILIDLLNCAKEIRQNLANHYELSLEKLTY